MKPSISSDTDISPGLRKAPSLFGIHGNSLPQLVDEAQCDRLRAVRAAMFDIEILKIYIDHVWNVDNLVPDKHRTSHYMVCICDKLYGARYD